LRPIELEDAGRPVAKTGGTIERRETRLIVHVQPVAT
jgi:hypothetical protein